MEEVVDSLRNLNDLSSCELLSFIRLGMPTWGDVLSLLAIIVSVCIFVCQMKRERENRDDNQKKTWFLEIIVKPRLDELHNSYLKLIDEVNQIVQELKKQDTAIPAAELRKLQSRGVAELFISINKMHEPFSILVKSYDYFLGKKLSDVSDELADIVSDIINGYSQITDEDVRGKLFKNFQSFMATLYLQFSNQKQ